MKKKEKTDSPQPPIPLAQELPSSWHCQGWRQGETPEELPSMGQGDVRSSRNGPVVIKNRVITQEAVQEGSHSCS